MLTRRTTTGIIGEILSLGPAGKTEIMYSANLSHKQLKSYLSFLTERGLLERVTDGYRVPHYVATDVGRVLLEHIGEVIRTLGTEDDDLSGWN